MRIDGQPWLRVVLRSRRVCERCARDLERGATAYRPLAEGRGVVRTFRLCVTCAARRAEVVD
jgi:hypothetical protein